MKVKEKVKFNYNDAVGKFFNFLILPKIDLFNTWNGLVIMISTELYINVRSNYGFVMKSFLKVIDLIMLIDNIYIKFVKLKPISIQHSKRFYN